MIILYHSVTLLSIVFGRKIAYLSDFFKFSAGFLV
nr:MAG TPA: hypothetical protein [Caudoviricetes sp.]